MQTFFITGLPRSGTAWISNYLSWQNCVCIHDAWKYGSPKFWKTKFETINPYAAGVSDPANVMLFDEINQEFPDAKWVLITRNIEDVKKSCDTINFPLADFTKSLEKLTKVKQVLKVQFKDLFNRADEIGTYIYEDWDCPTWRKDLLKDLNVQLHWGRVSEQFKVPDNLKQVVTMTPARIEFLRLVEEIVNKDPCAMRFCVQVHEVAHLYRNLDQGNAIDINKAKDLLEAITIEWPINTFLQRFASTLSPVLSSCIEEYNNNKSLDTCPIDLSLMNAVVFIFRGREGVKEWMPKIRKLSDKILKEKL